tara:strand:- start:827 stop:1171 length:345 start_codon:yes stop_codon:yes gene_type:complete
MAEKNVTLKDLIKEIDFRLTHLEDMEYDNRKLMIKLVKQGNTIVEFLKQLEVTEPPSLEEEMFLPKEPLVSADKLADIRELVDEFMDKASELKEFEEELKKHKDKLTPGQVGEA